MPIRTAVVLLTAERAGAALFIRRAVLVLCAASRRWAATADADYRGSAIVRAIVSDPVEKVVAVARTVAVVLFERVRH